MRQIVDIIDEISNPSDIVHHPEESDPLEHCARFADSKADRHGLVHGLDPGMVITVLASCRSIIDQGNATAAITLNDGEIIMAPVSPSNYQAVDFFHFKALQKMDEGDKLSIPKSILGLALEVIANDSETITPES